VGLFNKKKKDFDINIPITNPSLKRSIAVFNKTKTEDNLNSIVNSIKTAFFLVLIYNDGLLTKTGEDGKTIVEKGSRFKFLTTFDQNKDEYLPIFTDWKEIDLWVGSRDNIAGWVMTAKEIFDFELKHTKHKGVVINPMSERWNMNTEQMAMFIKDNY